MPVLVGVEVIVLVPVTGTQPEVSVPVPITDTDRKVPVQVPNGT